jgi:multidrug efflux pump subunit AcrA (membrane-fusion protein)
VKFDAWPDESFRGHISYLGDVVDPATRTISARIEVDNTEGKLRPGMFARVRLTDPHTVAPPDRPKSLIIPIGALLRAGEGFITFVKTGERRYERRTLRVIRRTSDFAEIAEGVKAGEPVVVRGGFILKSEAAKESMGGGHSH